MSISPYSLHLFCLVLLCIVFLVKKEKKEVFSWKLTISQTFDFKWNIWGSLLEYVCLLPYSRHHQKIQCQLFLTMPVCNQKRLQTQFFSSIDMVDSPKKLFCDWCTCILFFFTCIYAYVEWNICFILFIIRDPVSLKSSNWSYNMKDVKSKIVYMEIKRFIPESDK